MTLTFWVQAALAVMVLAVAVWTIAARNTFAAVAGFVAYGVLLSLAWVSLRAVDVALTEAAIGGGLTGVLMIGAAARLRGTERAVATERPAWPVRAAAAVLSAAVAAGIAYAVLALPNPAPTLAPPVAENLAATGLGNPVTAVLMAYRAIDTLLETVVLVFALIGVWSFCADGAWGGRPGRRQVADRDGVLAFGARVLAPFGIVAGIYILWVGADAPGGKFQSGTILAAMWLVVVMAGLARLPRIDRRWLRVAIVAGPLVFVAIGFAGIATAGAFLAYPEPMARTLIKAIEIALVPSVALQLALMLAGAPAEEAQR